MKIDFSRIEIFTDVAHKNCSICDLRTQFADVIYNMGQGVAAHALALKIYNSDYQQTIPTRKFNRLKPI